MCNLNTLNENGVHISFSHSYFLVMKSVNTNREHTENAQVIRDAHLTKSKGVAPDLAWRSNHLQVGHCFTGELADPPPWRLGVRLFL
jgi:hypothetical protein